MPLTIVSAEDRLDEVRALFQDYQSSLGIDLCFQGFEAELTSLPAPYDGLYLAVSEGQALGCVAFKRLSDEACELKRLFVRPTVRGQGIGRSLCDFVVSEASKRGYQTIRLDTLVRLEGAVRLYRSLGFAEIPPYHRNLPDEPLIFMERPLIT